MPTISVIVPVYKVEAYLYRCIDSILAQTCKDFELILVDDGSPDNCGAICDEYAAQDSRIIVIHQKNSGLSAARNAGIDWMMANSDSQWISFVDSDDYIHPKMLEVLLDAVLSTDTKISICGFQRTNGEDLVVDDIPTPQLWKPEDYYVQHNVNATVAWGKLYHRECFKEIRYPVGKLHEDEFVTYRILFNYHSIAVVGSSLYGYYQNQHSITASPWSPKRLDFFEACDQQILFFSKRGETQHEITRVKAYIQCIIRQITLLDLLPNREQFRVTRKWMEDKAKQLLLKYLFFDGFMCDEDMWLYAYFFPMSTKIICFFRIVRNKLL